MAKSYPWDSESRMDEESRRHDAARLRDLPKKRGGGPTEQEPDRPYCKDDQSCCDFCCGN